jgi:hypothetical protein
VSPPAIAVPILTPLAREYGIPSRRRCSCLAPKKGAKRSSACVDNQEDLRHVGLFHALARRRNAKQEQNADYRRQANESE